MESAINSALTKGGRIVDLAYVRGRGLPEARQLGNAPAHCAANSSAGCCRRHCQHRPHCSCCPALYVQAAIVHQLGITQRFFPQVRCSWVLQLGVLCSMLPTYM